MNAISAIEKANGLLEVPLEALRRFLVLDEATGRLFWKPRKEEDFNGEDWKRARACKTWNTRFAGKEAASTATRGYLRVAVHGVSLKAHRVVFALHHGRWPLGEVDHVNGVTSDNRPSNLRELSHSANCKNQKHRSTNTTGRMGIAVDSRRGNFVVTIYDAGEKRHIGCFSEKRDAIIARQAAERALNYHPNHGRKNL